MVLYTFLCILLEIMKINIVLSFILFVNLFQLFESLENLYDRENDLESFNEKISYDYEQVKVGPCTIPVETEPISQKDFLEKYAYSSPVVFRRSDKEKDRNKLFQEKCQLDNLISEYGNKFVTVSTANTYSYKKFSMKFSDYMNKYVLNNDENMPKLKYGNETWYFFGENNVTEWKNLLDLYERPKYKLPKHEHAYSFGIASGFTGVF